MANLTLPSCFLKLLYFSASIFEFGKADMNLNKENINMLTIVNTEQV